MDKDRTITVDDVLKRPILQCAKVVAGGRGLSRSIRWVHILENAAYTSYLKGGELVLSTGIGFGEDTTKRLLYLSELIQRKAAGLCIELGTDMPEVPSDMLELADHHDFPLIVFEERVHFVDITLDLHESIINKHNQALRELETYSRKLHQRTLQAPSLTGLIRYFQARVRTQTFFLTFNEQPLFIPSMSQGMQSEIIEILNTKLLSNDQMPETSGVIVISDTKKILYQPIVAMGHVLAYLGIILYESEPDEITFLTVDYTVTAIAQILLRKMFAEERSLAIQNRFLEDILQDKIRDEGQIIELMGINPKKPPLPSYWAAIVEISDEKRHYRENSDSLFHDLLPVFRSILSRYWFRPILLSKGSRLYLLLIETSQHFSHKENLHKALIEIERTCRLSLDLGSSSNLRVGISGISKKYSKVFNSFKEAEQVLLFAAEFDSPFFKDLGAYRLLLHIRDSYSLNSFIDDYLGPLIRYDQKHRSDLLTTLRVYLDLGQSKQEASERLYIRRQTLYQRLEKIHELLGGNYFSSEHRLCLEIALRIYEWHGKQKYLNEAAFYQP